MPNYIPGSRDMLGWGFNTFGEYSMASKTRKIFNLAKNGSDTQMVNGISYRVPDAVSVSLETESSASTQYCATASEVAAYFQGRAKVSGSQGAFSGEVEMAYGDTDIRNETHTYCIYDMWRSSYDLSIEGAGPDLVSSTVANDPVYKRLLKDVEAGVWSSAVQQHCVDFFNRYGTHFVSRVYMGGSLNWYGAVNKSYSEDQTTIEAKANLEYKALFTEAAADAQVDWKSISKQWVENRTAKVVTIGGGSNLLPAVLNPTYGQNFYDAVSAWLDSLESSPSAVNFFLSPVSDLFDDPNGILRQAYEAYVSGRIVVDATFQSVTGLVNNLPLLTSAYQAIQWTSYETPCLYSYVANVIDRATGAVVASAAHAGPSGRTFHDHGNQDPGLSALPSSIGDYFDKTDYLLVFLWCSVIDEYSNGFSHPLLAPSGDLMGFLLACGASPGWHSVLDQRDYEVKGPGIYLLVGVCGASGLGIERTVDVTVVDSVEIPKSPLLVASLPLVPLPVGGKNLWTPVQL